MTAVRDGLDLLLGAVAALAWSFAGFALGARYVSLTAGEILGIGLLSSAVVTGLTVHLRDRRLGLLTEGLCPRCRQRVVLEHRHRRWEPAPGEWRPPVVTWDCPSCAYSHAESWPCPACPE